MSPRQYVMYDTKMAWYRSSRFCIDWMMAVMRKPKPITPAFTFRALINFSVERLRGTTAVIKMVA